MEKFVMEFVIQASPKLLFNYIATPSGLSEWYADNVNSRGEGIHFYLGWSRRTSSYAEEKK